MAQTPPLPAHIPPPADTDDAPPGSDQGGGDNQAKGQDKGASSGGLPRREVTSPDERPPSMAAAAQALAGKRGPASTQDPAPTAPPGLAPPVIPGAGGAGRGATSPAVPAPAARPAIPPAAANGPQSAPPATGRPQGAPAAANGPQSAPPATSRPQGAPPATASPSWPDAEADRPATDPKPTDSNAADSNAADPDKSGSRASGVDFDDDFVPANEVERDLYHAVDEGSTDSFLSTLLLATVLVPVANNSRPGSAPGESGFAFRTEEIDGDRFLVVFTSRDRLSEHFAEPTRTVGVRFVDLIRNWPDPAWSFAVNPTSPVGAKYPGPQVIALATWAVEAGLGGDPVDAPAEQPQQPAETTAQLTVMQKAVPADQIDYYLERGYDRIAGFVHRSGEVEHLRSPGELFAALGLLYDGSPYQGDAKEAFVLRWPAHRPSLYRIPYGGQSEQALRAMDGWVIERPPFRGNGFAPGEGKDVIAEFKVDSVRLPHGAQLWRMDADGAEQMIAVFDCDAPVWRRVGGQ